MIYFDNAATSYPKPRSVIKASVRCLKEYCANPGRSTHDMAVRSAEAVYETREIIADYIGFASPERIAFTSNATHALNIAIKGLINHRCHVIVSDMEHNSVMRPLEAVARKYGVEISVYDTDLPLREAIIPLVRPDTEFLVTSIASNVTGKTLSVREISEITRACSIKVIVDASQYLGHKRVDLSATPLDVICAPGHKGLLGIQGSGFIAVGESVDPDDLMQGGSGGDTFRPEMPDYLPEKLEAGTLNVPAIVALGAGVRYLREYGYERIENVLSRLTDRLYNTLLSVGATIYGCGNGIAAFELPGISPSSLSGMLDMSGIATRSGLHCAPGIHRKLGTDKYGCVRVSLSIFNTETELDMLYNALNAVKN